MLLMQNLINYLTILEIDMREIEKALSRSLFSTST